MNKKLVQWQLEELERGLSLGGVTLQTRSYNLRHSLECDLPVKGVMKEHTGLAAGGTSPLVPRV